MLHQSPSSSSRVAAVGAVSGNTTVGPANFSQAGVGVFTYNYTFAAAERVNFTLLVSGNVSAGPYGMTARGSTPDIVDLAATLAAAKLQNAGEAGRAAVTAGGSYSVADKAWHTLYLPVAKKPSGSFVADPRLTVGMVVSPIMTNGSIDTSKQANFTAYWSWTNGSYVVNFKLNDSISYAAGFMVMHPNATNTTVSVWRMPIGARACILYISICHITHSMLLRRELQCGACSSTSSGLRHSQ